MKMLARLLPVALGAACGGGLAPMPIPAGLAPAGEAAAIAWADSTRPAESRDVRFRFLFQDDRSSAGGRGRARLALPDSIRFDVRGPLGSGQAAAFVVGDTAIWAEPEEDVKKLVPNFPLFWAMLGIVRRPDSGSHVRTLRDGTVTAWQFASGGDTVEYVRLASPEPRLIAEVRERGRRVGRVETRFGTDGLPSSSRLVVPGKARLDLTFYQNTKAGVLAPETWARPAPAQQ